MLLAGELLLECPDKQAVAGLTDIERGQAFMYVLGKINARIEECHYLPSAAQCC